MFIDLQVNGYAGIYFNGDPLTVEQLQHVCDKLEADRVRAVIPTFITDDVDAMARRIGAMCRLIDQSPPWRRMFPAFHIEGPCISPDDGCRGDHPAEHVRPETPQLYEPLLEAAGGPDRVAIVTLAPEVDKNLATTQWLAEQGIIVSAGHTNASYELLCQAVEVGVKLCTHLSNGCMHVIVRHDNIINRALALDKLICTFIPDGHHIPFWVLKGWLRHIGLERSIFVTDCMAAAAAPPGTYRMGSWRLQVGPDRLVHPPGADHLAGSALTMPEAYDHAHRYLDITPYEADRLCASVPAKLITKWMITS